jgi:Flp pilus assembly protein TadG
MRSSAKRPREDRPASGGRVRRAVRFAVQRGQAMVELAAITPVLIVVLLGAADLSRVYYLSIALNNAARAGVQYGVQSSTTAADTSGMQTAATNDTTGISGVSATASEYCQCPTGGTFLCSVSNSCTDKRVYVKVVTSATFTTLFNYPGIPHTVSLTGQAVMREQ